MQKVKLTLNGPEQLIEATSSEDLKRGLLTRILQIFAYHKIDFQIELVLPINYEHFSLNHPIYLPVEKSLRKFLFTLQQVFKKENITLNEAPYDFFHEYIELINNQKSGNYMLVALFDKKLKLEKVF